MRGLVRRSGKRETDLRRSIRLIGHVAAFEIGRQARQPVVWVAGLIFFAFALLLISNEGVLGTPVLDRNAPAELAKGVIILSVFYIFAVVALAGDAALRDAASGFEDILRSTPVSRLERLLGRFIGLQAVAVFTFVAATSGFLVGAVAPWTDQNFIGPFNWPQVFAIVLVIAIPTIVVVSAICFTIAAALRSTTATYVAVVVMMLVIRILPEMARAMGDVGRHVAALMEPFGWVGFYLDGAFADPARRAVVAFAWDGLLIANRVTGLAFAVVMLGAAFVFERRVDEARLRSRPDGVMDDPPAPSAAPRRTPQFGLSTWAAQFLLRLRFEVGSLLRSPSLLILFAILLTFGVFSLWSANELAGTPSLPATRVMAESLYGWMIMIGLIITGFYAGEIVWRERDRRVDELIDATPVPDLLLLAPKVIAVGLVLFLVGVAGVVAAIGVQLAKGYMDGTPGQYLSLVIVPVALQMVFLAAFAMASAALAPNRFVGWGMIALLLAFSMTAQSIGFSHLLFDFGSAPDPSLSEMNPEGDGSRGFTWIVLYWCGWGGLLLVLTWLFWPRGQRAPVRSAIVQARRRLRGPGGVVAGALVLTTMALGGFIFINTNVWSRFYTTRETEAELADYERAMKVFEAAPQPSIVDVRMTVDIEPRRTRLTTSGQYMLENRTDRPLSEVHIQLPSDDEEWVLSLEGARRTKTFDAFEFCIFTFDRPLQPGERRRLTFANTFAPKGFGAAQTSVVRNGTFVRNHEMAPIIGVAEEFFLTDADARKRQGLPPERSMRDPLAAGARDRNYIRADLATLDITVVTDADQTPIAPGRLVSDTVNGDRRTARFVSDKPVLTFFSIQSARYAVRRTTHKGVAIAVYFHPGHGQNVDRMIRALKGGLDIYQVEFGPYGLDYLRIVEFPAHETYAQAFAGTIPFSENIGFIADVRNPNHFDYVTSVTLHELAHQWWGHQLVGADAKGALLLSEGLSDYSAAMAQAKLQGWRMANQDLELASSNYHKGVADRREAQPPLYRVERQQYVAYNQAEMAFVVVRAEIGEAAFHRALRRLLADYGSRDAPYPISDDLLAAIEAESSPQAWKRLEPLFLEPGRMSFAAFPPPTGWVKPPHSTNGKGDGKGRR